MQSQSFGIFENDPKSVREAWLMTCQANECSPADARAMYEPTIKQLADSVDFSLPANYNSARMLWDNIGPFSKRAAIIHDSGVWTFSELADEAARIGNHLQEFCAPGERILMLMEDEPEYPAALMGCMRAGFVPVLINTLSPPELVEFYLQDSGATAAIHSAGFESLLNKQVVLNTRCKVVLNSHLRPWQTNSAELEEFPTRRRDQAFWMYSSGSTGRPKGIVHLHEDAPYTAETYSAETLVLYEDDICFSIPKIFFAYGFGNSVTFPMSRGAAAVLLSGRPTPERIFEQIEKHRPTVLFGLPTLYTALMHHPRAGHADLSSVRLCISAAEILSEELAARWKSLFDLNIIEGLGSTEMLHIYLSNDEEWQKPGSAGRVVSGYAVQLKDMDGREVEQGEEGIMHVRGLSAAETYWNRPEKTRETMRDDWIVTGDCFVMDEDGFYFFKGRADDLVKVSGQWVYPMEIETTLNEHPMVRECCVQAVELEDRRMTITAWVALVEGGNGDESMTRELQSFTKSRLLPHKYPRDIIYLDTLPKTGTDKVDRQALKKLDAP